MSAAVELRPIGAGDLPRVGRFLSVAASKRIPAPVWAESLRPSWSTTVPNHGFMLLADERVVGVYAAFYSERAIGGETRRICNLAVWAVDDAHRAEGLRLVRAMLRQAGFDFTDLSPSGNVVELNKRLGFAELDTTCALVPNLPYPVLPRDISVICEPGAIEARLSGEDLVIYRDHARARAARHVVLADGAETCHVMFRRDRRRKLPLFASILHVSNAPLFARGSRHVFRHLLVRHRIPFTLAELRVVGERPRPSWLVPAPRPKMFRSDKLRPDQIDYLYSELTCVAW
jgi:hypothetical protein